MQQIYDKINAHKYLSKEDIVHFVEVFSSSEIKTIFSTGELFDAYYDAASNSIVIDKKFGSKDLDFLINFSKEKLKLELKEENFTFLVDLYNLFLVQTLFHELQHANQTKLTNRKMTLKTKLIKENYNFMIFDYQMYAKNHDLYYNEYDATITALIKTLNVIEEKCKNLNKNSIIEYNRIMCGIIYHSYGNKYSSDNVSEEYDKFECPIAYSEFLSNQFNNSYEKFILLLCTRNLKKESITEYQKLINGFKLSETTIQLLYDIYIKKHCTLNILNEVKETEKIKMKIK